MMQHHARNVEGQDYVVGDIHGCFTLLQQELDKVQFDPAKDRLFSVGDLVDRGPESEQAFEWLSKPWFHAVRGNHEQIAIDYVQGFGDTRIYVANGGAWFIGLTKPEQRLIADAFEALPIAIEVETELGLVGIVHADCPTASWGELEAALAGPNGDAYAQECMWNWGRYRNRRMEGIKDVVMVFVGHIVVPEPINLDNVVYIDTGACFKNGNGLTLVTL